MNNDDQSFIEIETKNVGISSGSSSVLTDVLIGVTATQIKSKTHPAKPEYETRVVLRGTMEEDDFNELLPDMANMLYSRIWTMLDKSGKTKFLTHVSQLINETPNE